MTRTIKIANISLPCPVILAPMAGVTDYPFRTMVRRFGPCLVTSEMIASQALVRDSQRSMRMAGTAQEESPLSVQLSGSDPGTMAEAAKIIQDTGAALIDINMGCPQPKIVKTGAGAALMKDETRAGEIIKAIVQAVRIPVTVKIRLGWDFSSINAMQIAKIAEAEGASMVTVHARTRSQMFSGTADWSLIRPVKETVRIPVVANGDIKAPRDAEECLKLSGADGLMIGRGALGRPWLISHIDHFMKSGEILPEPGPEILHRLMTDHLKLILDFYREPVGIWLARRHICYYTKGKRGGAQFRESINKAKTSDEMASLIDSFFEAL